MSLVNNTTLKSQTMVTSPNINKEGSASKICPPHWYKQKTEVERVVKQWIIKQIHMPSMWGYPTEQSTSLEPQLTSACRFSASQIQDVQWVSSPWWP